MELITEAPLAAGELVLNGTAVTLEQEGVTARTRFQLTEDGEYYLAARVGGEQIRLTDDYFIKLLEDGKPAIELVRPGRDWNASSIEEVTARVDARDDFGLESLELRYAVNGGDWQSVPLPVDTRETVVDHVFMLEAMGGSAGALVPGDLIAYYAMGADRDKTARTDMYFIEVQPFDRRYTQSQQSGGMMGGGMGQPEQEISKRQKGDPGVHLESAPGADRGPGAGPRRYGQRRAVVGIADHSGRAGRNAGTSDPGPGTGLRRRKD